MKFPFPLQESFPLASIPLCENMFPESRGGLSPARRRALALEDRVALFPPMHLVASGTLDRILILDGQHLERLRIHRKARIHQLSRSWALDQYAVHPLLISARTDEPVASKGPPLQRFPDTLPTSRTPTPSIGRPKP